MSTTTEPTTTDKTTAKAQATNVNVKEDLANIEAVKEVDFTKAPWKDLPVITCTDSECSEQFRQAKVAHPNGRKFAIRVKENGNHTCQPQLFNTCNTPACNERRSARNKALISATLGSTSKSTTATSAPAFSASAGEDLNALANGVKDLITKFVNKHKKHKLLAMVAFQMDGGVDGSDGAESLLRFPPSKIPVEIGDAAKDLLALCYNAKDATGEGSTEAGLLRSASTLTAAGSKMMAAASEIIRKKDKVTERGKNGKLAIAIEDNDEGAVEEEDEQEDGKRSH